jgi:hypothetical protein
MIICIYEDRYQQLVGVKLLILSLLKHCPDLKVLLTCPVTDPSFRHWLSFYPQVLLKEEKLVGFGSFNIKPAVLLNALASGNEECIWIDTDIIINGDIIPLLKEPSEVVIVTQDPWEFPSGSSHRAKTFTLEVGRDLEGAFNSGVVRVTSQHIPLLEAWLDLIQFPEYVKQQALPGNLRHFHMTSDQDILSALLASKKFSHVPIKKLRHGREILQHHGAGAYGIAERWSIFFSGLPPLIHAMGSVKPWQMTDNELMIQRLDLTLKNSLIQNMRLFYEKLYLELSPYVNLAQQYQSSVNEPTEWINKSTLLGKISNFLSFNHPSLRGFVQAELHELLFSFKLILFLLKLNKHKILK